MHWKGTIFFFSWFCLCLSSKSDGLMTRRLSGITSFFLFGHFFFSFQPTIRNLMNMMFMPFYINYINVLKK